MSFRKARRELQKLKEAVAPKHLSQELFLRFEDETEAESLTPGTIGDCGLFLVIAG